MRNIQIIIILLFLVQCTSSKKVLDYDQSMVDFRETYKNGFLQDPRSPLTKEDLPYLDFFAPDKNWNLSCSCTKVEGAKPFELPTYSGVTRTYIEYADVICPYNQQTIALKIYKNISQPINPLYKNHLFLPFKDHTNGDTTYGGGRYINLYTTDIVDGKVKIDFNKAYNPWCAYSEGYNCPIPPKENHLEMKVLAGEKNYKGAIKTK
jgi:uncharacterized protein (DUF1684 family)